MEHADRKLAAILSCDAVGYSAHMARDEGRAIPLAEKALGAGIKSI